jgi:hypothetical protein
VEVGVEKLRREVAKRVWIKVEHPRRALWTINHSSRMLKTGKYVASIHLAQRFWPSPLALPEPR